MIARTFREVQAQTGRERAEPAGQKERLEARLAELKRAIGRLARSDGDDDREFTSLAQQDGARRPRRDSWNRGARLASNDAYENHVAHATIRDQFTGVGGCCSWPAGPVRGAGGGAAVRAVG